MKKFIMALTLPTALCLLSAAAVISNMRTVEPVALTSAQMTSPELTKLTDTSQTATSQNREPAAEIPEIPTAAPAEATTGSVTEPITTAPTESPTAPPTEPPTEPPPEPSKEPQIAPVMESPACDGFYLPEYVECAGSGQLWMDAILQNPEMPTGCEVTALDTVLRYYGFGIDKGTLFDCYMPSAAAGCSIFDEAFIGDPRSASGWGCFAPVVAQTACNYLWDIGSDMAVYNLTGFELYDLFSYIDSGCPVIVWASMELRDVSWTYRWTIGGTEAWFPKGEHCMVLTGYDIAAGKVYAADPLKGNVEYDLWRFGTVYNEMLKQAVVII